MAWSLKNEGAIWWFHGIELTKFVRPSDAKRQIISALNTPLEPNDATSKAVSRPARVPAWSERWARDR